MKDKKILKIIKEEVVRDEVRKIFEGKLSDDLSSKKKAFNFFNSALGIFILSTIFVSLGSFIASQVITYIESKKRENEEIYQLTNEMNYRGELIKEMNKVEFWEKEYFGVLAAYYGFDGERNPNDYYMFKSIYKKYEHRTLNALLVELKYLTGEELEELSIALREFKTFEKNMSIHPIKIVETEEETFKFYKMNSSDSILFYKSVILNIEKWQKQIH